MRAEKDQGTLLVYIPPTGKGEARYRTWFSGGTLGKPEPKKQKRICRQTERSSEFRQKRNEKLEIVNVHGGAAQISANAFELFQEYTAKTIFYRHDPSAYGDRASQVPSNFHFTKTF